MLEEACGGGRTSIGAGDPANRATKAGAADIAKNAQHRQRRSSHYVSTYVFFLFTCRSLVFTALKNNATQHAGTTDYVNRLCSTVNVDNVGRAELARSCCD